MAVTQTGSVFHVGTGGTFTNTGTLTSTLTVPADADFVVVTVTSFSSTAGFFSGGTVTFTKGGVDTAMTAASNQGDSDTGKWMSAMWYMVAPDTGTNKSVKWDWVGASNASDNSQMWTVTFWKGVDQTTPVRDTKADQLAAFPWTTPTLTAQSGDLILAGAFGFESDTESTIDSWSNLTLLYQAAKGGNGDGALATGSPSGNTTVAASSGTNFAGEGSIVAIVIIPAGEPWPPAGSFDGLLPIARSGMRAR